MLMDEEKWIQCPTCDSNTKTKIREDTELTNFPLFCPKCKGHFLINVNQFHITIITEPDAQTQSR